MADPLQAMYEEKARAEIEWADSLVPGSGSVAGSGDVLGRTLLVKGRPGPEDLARGKALAGADGEAARKALDALGVDTSSVFGICSRPVEDAAPDRLQERLAFQIEAVDPALIIALDEDAAVDVVSIAGLERPAYGDLVEWRGRRIVAIEGLEASLADEARKRRVWSQFKAIAPGVAHK